MNGERYHVVIIGAGIGGLISGCLLALAKKKVLIVEKNDVPGGYCTSFKHFGLHFDTCAHSLGDLSKEGKLFAILKKIGVLEKVKQVRYDPGDIIVTKDFEVRFNNSLDKTIRNLSRIFPKEKKAISVFFKNVICRQDFIQAMQLNKQTFSMLLDDHFIDLRLKKILGLFPLGNLGTPANHVSAFIAVKHFKQFIVDGGYYLSNGMDDLPRALAQRFITLGGKLSFGSEVVSVKCRNKTAVGIILRNGREVSADFIISACDLKNVFTRMLTDLKIKRRAANIIRKMRPSLSLFVAHVVLKRKLCNSYPSGTNVWYLRNYEYDRTHKRKINYSDMSIGWIMLRIGAGKKTVTLFTNAPYRGSSFWRRNKMDFFCRILALASDVVPGIDSNIKSFQLLTPFGLSKMTGNHKGAGYGWASTPSQSFVVDLLGDGVVRNLFLSGHWGSVAQGIPGVAIAGERVSRIILSRMKNVKI